MAHAVGPVLGLHAHTNRTRDARVAECRLPAPEDRRPGEGQRLAPEAPHNSGRPTPPGDGPPSPPRHAAPQRACKPRGQCLAPTLAHPRPQHAGGGPDSPRRGRAARGGEAPELRRPPQRQKAPPRGDALLPPPQCATTARRGTTLWGRCWGRHHPRGTQPPQGVQAKGTLLGPHSCTPAPTARW